MNAVCHKTRVSDRVDPANNWYSQNRCKSIQKQSHEVLCILRATCRLWSRTVAGKGNTAIDFNECRIKTIMLIAAIHISVNLFVTEPKGTFHVWLGGKPTHNGGQECSCRIYTTKEKGKTFLYASMWIHQFNLHLNGKSLYRDHKNVLCYQLNGLHCWQAQGKHTFSLSPAWVNHIMKDPIYIFNFCTWQFSSHVLSLP